MPNRFLITGGRAKSKFLSVRNRRPPGFFWIGQKQICFAAQPLIETARAVKPTTLRSSTTLAAPQNQRQTEA